MPATRFVLGPKFDFTRHGVPAGPVLVNGKPDVAVTYAGPGKTADGRDSALIALPAYDPAAFNPLAEVRVYLVPNGTQPPADGPGFVASAFPFSVADVSGHIAGGTINEPLPDVPAGPAGTDAAYLGQIVLGFAS